MKNPISRLVIVFLAAAFLPACFDGFSETSCKNYFPSTAATPLWKLLSPSSAGPGGRELPAMEYDATNDLLIVFGGDDGKNRLNDVWILTDASGKEDSSEWIALAPTGTAPSARTGTLSGYNSTANTLIIFGGSAADDIQMDLWLLSNANNSGGTPVWSHPAVSGNGPSARAYMAGIYDEANDKLVFFGGRYCASSTCTLYDDTWAITNVTTNPTWVEVAPSGGAPAKRAYHAAAYDTTNDRMIVFGGTSSTAKLASASAALNDTWILSNASGGGGAPTWNQLSTSRNPKSMFGQTAVYDSDNDRFIVFGGTNSNNIALNGVWILTDSKGASPAWGEYTTGTPEPDARAYSRAVFLGSAKNKMTLFGGAVGNTKDNDVWVLTHANGIPKTPVNSVEILAVPELCTGYTAELRATPLDADGKEITGVFVLWSSSDEDIATVSANGVALGLGVGTTTMTANADGVTDTMTLTVVSSSSN